MKTIKFNKFLLLALSLVVLNACVQDDDFDTPDLINANVVDFPDEQIMSISSILGSYYQEGTPVTFEFNTPRYMEGYVVSSDEGGNFYKQIVLQDAPENPTAAIVVQIDINPVFTRFEFGRKIFIKVNNLTVAEDNGVVQLGRLDGEDLNRIPSSLVNDHVFRSEEIATIVPKEVSIGQFSEALESQYIRLTNVQFRDDQIGMTFASESGDDFDGERVLESCVGSSVILSTSTFSDFKALPLPDNRGYVDGILTRDFFDDFYTIYLNSPEDINFDNPDPCPEPLLASNFNDATDNTTFNFEGWLNIAQEGSELWTEQVYQGNGYAEFTAFGTNESSNIGWLISPPMDLDAEDGEVLTFQTEHAYPDSGHDALKVYISTDFDGTAANVLNATWEELDFTSSLEVDFEEWFTWADSGAIDLSSYSGTGYIAFVYTGSDNSNLNTTIHVDNVFVVVQ
ncbi:DUF5689 domain-containing protein [Psychroserpens sp. XS_ASV72]|uniref:DUF5689 domain-containing protein n=1 Tax=Psychroserpens sp. XS_ASV72 TaxID=3241293 RepID=UPI0035183EB4